MKKSVIIFFIISYSYSFSQKSWINKKYIYKEDSKESNNTSINNKENKAYKDLVFIENETVIGPENRKSKDPVFNENKTSIDPENRKSKDPVFNEKKEFFLNPIRPQDWSKISSKYGSRKHPILHTIKHHTGIDIPAPIGTPVYAVLSGFIEVKTYDNINGNYIKINHQNGYITAYCHLSKFNVNKGQFVERGQIIGYVGNTGRATGPHLHYEVRFKGERKNPEHFLLFK
ncbi:M23 family metallopeptidase [Apibacter sp. wkB309]|uniref:M23 family metallopeptidase n=1 Tax=Apibacter sp. wkB309 TaxID=1679467 RepID=UPI000CF9AAD1|nr:M23 family metallopeptidase [Apibacter sp. wkB309]PQL90928.1 hypothetical protein C4S75_05525 [Apibacter sp. wkB309]